MSHVTHIYTSEEPHMKLCSSSFTGRVTQIYKSCNTRIYISIMSHTYMYELCHTHLCIWFMSHMYVYTLCHTHIYEYTSEEPHTKSRSGPFTCHVGQICKWWTHVYISIMSRIHIYESCYTYIHMSHVTRVYIWAMSHRYIYISDLKWSCTVNPLPLMSHKCISHVTLIYTHQFCHTLVYMSYVTRKYIWVMSHDVYKIHVTHTYICQKSLKRSRACNGLFTCHGEDPQDALSCRSFFAEEPPMIGLFCGKWP